MTTRWCANCRDYLPTDHECAPSLFDVVATTLSRTTDPETSKAAAVRVDAAFMRGKLLAVFARGEHTAEEASRAAGYTPADGAWKRVSDLKNLGLIEPTGTTRTASSGREQAVMRVTAKGLAT